MSMANGQGYQFAYVLNRENQTIIRSEKSDSNGNIFGAYKVTSSAGIFKLIKYQMSRDNDHFMAKIFTNKPGGLNVTFPSEEIINPVEESGNPIAAIVATESVSNLLAETTTELSEGTTKLVDPVDGMRSGSLIEAASITTESSDLVQQSTTLDTIGGHEVEEAEEVATEDETSFAPVKEEDSDEIRTPTVPMFGTSYAKYWYEYEIPVEGGRILRTESTDATGKVIATYRYLPDNVPSKTGDNLWT